MGIIFVPFLIGTGALFFDARKTWAWVLSGIGLLLIVIEILSRIRFHIDAKVTHLLLIMLMITAGAGFLARGYLVQKRASSQSNPDEPTQ